MKLPLLSMLLIFVVSCSQSEISHRQTIDLSGKWEFAFDTTNSINQNDGYLTDFTDTIQLPGTTDSNQKGYRNTDTTTQHLNRLYTYEGAAWYRKKVVIPEEFNDKYIRLFLERTKPSKVWIDSNYVGSSILLQSPQTFDVSEHLSPGEHDITLRIDNSLELTPYGHNHIYSDDTQTNWNGVIGDLYLEAMPKTHISDLQVFPDVDNKSATIKLGIENGLELDSLSIDLVVELHQDGKTYQLPTTSSVNKVRDTLDLTYNLSDNLQLWSEFQQPLYKLTAVISNGEIKDSKTVTFGMRSFEAKGTQFTVNDLTTFLRGKHEAAVFPETGHTPTDVESWKRVYKIAKSYGINHYRFHSYTPPKAAFIAADQVGMYLQPELPFWGGLDEDSVALMQREEGFALLKAFANHPSFVMFSHGNEIWSGHDRVEANIKALKKFDSRPLYTMGSNNNIGYVWPRVVSDFFVASRTPSDGDTIKTHTRLTHAFVDSKDGGILNTQTPSTNFDYSYPVSQIDIPLVSHEIGQYQIYPDYDEIEKYTGVLRAWNLEKFRDDLKASGMGDMDSLFQQASGAWSAIAYKAEMEAALRTEGMAGFQLLDLQDFPGQGTALVGILDAFMESKGVVSREEWLQSCNEGTILMRFPKYVWTTSETYQAEIQVANYSASAINTSLKWELRNDKGVVIQNEIIDKLQIPQGTLSTIGNIALDLSTLNVPEQFTIHLSSEGTNYSNSYPLWVYPSDQSLPEPDDILITETLNTEILNALQAGEKVLYFPEEKEVAGNSVGGLFPPNFWNYEMFKGISENNEKPYSPGTLGLLMNPDHPIFNAFPTDFHTNWQWYSIIKESNPLILNETPDSYRPVVQVIDNLQRNHKLGLIFEFSVGEGKLLVSMSRLNELHENPEAVQLYQSILKYMKSDDFAPEQKISKSQLKELFNLREE